MNRVLIVSPRFVPTNAADMHRTRQALPYLPAFGWEPTVLAVEPHEVEAPQDPLLLRTVPDGVRVVRTGAVPLRLTRRFGIRSLEARAVAALRRAGGRLLAEARAAGAPFDLVFFSTTAMGVTVLGPLWERQFGVPFGVDLQDPWYSEYYKRTNTPPPGGRVKYSVANALAAQLEPAVLRRASAVVAVSPTYPCDLADRYGWFDIDRATVLPFGAPEQDFETLREAAVANPVFDPADGRRHWAYVGAVGPMMRLSVEAFFAALARHRAGAPDRLDGLRLHFVGTSYAAEGQAKETVAPLAERWGVGDLVEERTSRVPYFEALQCLLDADALVVPGSDDPGYTASKLYPYVLARRPLLAVFHEGSTVVDVVRQVGAGVVVPFGSESSLERVADDIEAAWFEPRAWGHPPDTDWDAFEPYTARRMTQTLAGVFDRVLATARPSSTATA